eukprot:2910051-Pleurochrysis_carterae.AAC.1
MTMRVDFAIVRSVKSHRAYFSYMYALVDEDGEVTLPQDKLRRALAMDLEALQRLRAVAFANVRNMAAAGIPMSPVWLDKLGEDYTLKARDARRARDAELQCRPRATSSTAGSSRASPAREDDEEQFEPPQMM